MSKRSNRNIHRRQVRRALKTSGDTIQHIGTRKVMRIGYGAGLSRCHVRGEQKAARMDNHMDQEVFY